MKVTVNACRKKRKKVDVTAVNTRRDVIRVPVKRINQYTGKNTSRYAGAYADPGSGEESAENRAAYDESAELSAIFDSSEFEDKYYVEDNLPEIFVKPVRLLNELADTRPELDDLPPYFNPRLMTEEEELAEYSAPERLVPERQPGGDAEQAEDTGAAKKDGAKKGSGTPAAQQEEAGRSGRRPAAREIAENYSTEELLAIIESQQQEKKRRDKEQAKLKKQRERERAERARKFAEERAKETPTHEEISREEDTLFMWWSELDAQDGASDGDAGVFDDDESFTQMQITGDIPKAKKRGAAYIRAAQEEIEARAADDGVEKVPGEVFQNIRGAFSTGTAEEQDDASGEVFDSIRGAFSEEAGASEDEEFFDEAGEAAEEEPAYAEEEEPGYAEEEESAGSSEEDYASEEDYEEYDEEEEYYEEDDPDTSVNVRYFDRDKQGGRVEVGRSEAKGQEVVIIDNESGRMKRICGIIKHGQKGADAADSSVSPESAVIDDNDGPAE